MDLLSTFAVGATLWTVGNIIPLRHKMIEEEIILETWKQTGTMNKDGLLPEKKNGAWFLPAGLSQKDIEKSVPALSYQLNADVELEWRGKALYLRIFPGSLPTSLLYETQDLSKYKLGLTIGKTRKKDCYVFDMNDTHPYLIVAGAPGQGKSNFLAQALRQISENYSPEQVQWYLVDLKLGVELKRFSRNEYEPYCGGYAWDTRGNHLEAMLGSLSREIRRRMITFDEAGVLKIDEYNALPDTEKLPYLLLVIDEYAELRRQKEAEEKLQSLLQIGRAAGLRCLLSTQRPSATNLSTDIRGLIADRLTFRLPDRTNSEIVLDLPGAEELPCPGRCLLLHGAHLLEAQVMRS
jgi:S-DNA-T family DNA segregation ATPase FtsK/SpoIIIE